VSDYVIQTLRRYLDERESEHTKKNTSVMTENPLHYQLNAARIDELRRVRDFVQEKVAKENTGA
jgi:hypothetical protein